MIIGLSGYARSGKDTVAGMLIGLYGYENKSFAGPIKDALLALNPILEDGHRLNEVVQSVGWEKAKARSEVRRLLQVFGTEVGRKMFGEGFWVNLAFANVGSSMKVVFTDVRFPNEADFIKEFYGEVWRIERPGVHAVNNHPSESAMDGYTFDRVIRNDGDLEALKAKIAEGIKVKP